MYKNKKIIAIVPARGGSKSIKNKNIIKVNKKPLIHYTLENAIKSKYLDRIIVSTDSKIIKNVCKNYDVPFLRPKKYSQDYSLTSDVIFHAIDYLSKKNIFFYDYIMLLQPTSPLRLSKDIDASIKKLINSKFDSLISVVNVGANHPSRMYKIYKNKLLPIFGEKISMMPRQKLENIYIRNGSIYLTSLKSFKKYKSFISKKNMSYEMPLERSVNIDIKKDLENLKQLLKW